MMLLLRWLAVLILAALAGKLKPKLRVYSRYHVDAVRIRLDARDGACMEKT